MEQYTIAQQVFLYFARCLQCFSRFAELFANAETGKYAIKHRFSELFARDLPQGTDRLAQVDRLEIPGQLLGRHLLTAAKSSGGSSGQIPLALVQR